jgi:hypothetical protein
MTAVIFAAVQRAGTKGGEREYLWLISCPPKAAMLEDGLLPRFSLATENPNLLTIESWASQMIGCFLDLGVPTSLGDLGIAQPCIQGRTDGIAPEDRGVGVVAPRGR